MMFAPHSMAGKAETSVQSQNIKLYVKLRREETPTSESSASEKPKKLVLLAPSRAKIFELKR